MSTQALELREPQQSIQQANYQWKSPSVIKQRIIAIQQLLDEVLKPGNKGNEFSGDYGIIPGTGNKPSLWKSGSEQILAMFEIAVDPIVEDLSNSDCFRYRVTARLTHAPSGTFLGAGIGEASTDETKYKWKKTFSQKEFEGTDPERRKTKYSQYKDGNGMWADKEEWQIRTEPADLANTVLKMAKKRAQIDATLTVTGASSMFSQDLEDLEGQESVDPKPEKKSAKPQASVKCSECNAEGGHLPNCSKKKAQAQAAAPVKPASEVKPPMQKSEPKAEGPTICNECRQVNGHKSDCFYANGKKAEEAKAGETKSEAKTEPQKQEKAPPALCKITAVTEKFKKLTPKEEKAGKTQGARYLVLDAMAQDGTSGKLYVWKTDLHPFLLGKENALLVCEVSRQETPDKKVFYQLEEILELAGQKFKDNVPMNAVAQVDTPEDESMFGGE